MSLIYSQNIKYFKVYMEKTFYLLRALKLEIETKITFFFRK